MVVPDVSGCADVTPGQQGQQGAPTRPLAEEHAQPPSAQHPSATSVNPKCRALLLLVQRSAQVAVARQLAARRLRQRRQRQVRLMLLLIGMRRRLLEKPRRRVIKRTDGGWEASTINNYVTCGDAKTYQLNFRMSKVSFDCILERDACPSCTRRGVLHCSHTAQFKSMRAASGSSAAEIRDAIKTSLWEEMRANNEDVAAVMAELAERAAAQGD